MRHEDDDKINRNLHWIKTNTIESVHPQ